jgi:hypothetical protein
MFLGQSLAEYGRENLKAPIQASFNRGAIMSITESRDSGLRVLLVTTSVRRHDIDGADDPQDTLAETTDITPVDRPVRLAFHHLIVRGTSGRQYRIVVTARTELVGGPS